MTLAHAVLPQSLEFTLTNAREFDLIGRYSVAYDRPLRKYALGVADVWSWFLRKHRFNVLNYDEIVSTISSQNGGYYHEPIDYIEPQEDDIRHNFTPDSFSVDPVIGLSRVASRHGVPFYFMFLPKAKGSITAKYQREAEELLSQWQTNYPIDFVWTKAPIWPKHLHSDPNHLHRTGSKRFSEHCGLKIRGFFDSDTSS